MNYDKDKAVGDFINAFWKAHFRSPSIRDIARGCHISSTSVALNVVKRIARTRGDLLATDGSARGIVPAWVVRAINSAKIDIEHNQ